MAKARQVFKKGQMVQIGLHYWNLSSHYSDTPFSSGEIWQRPLKAEYTEQDILKSCQQTYSCGQFHVNEHIWSTFAVSEDIERSRKPTHRARCHCGEMEWLGDNNELIVDTWQAAFNERET